MFKFVAKLTVKSGPEKGSRRPYGQCVPARGHVPSLTVCRSSHVPSLTVCMPSHVPCRPSRVRVLPACLPSAKRQKRALGERHEVTLTECTPLPGRGHASGCVRVGMHAGVRLGACMGMGKRVHGCALMRVKGPSFGGMTSFGVWVTGCMGGPELLIDRRKGSKVSGGGRSVGGSSGRKRGGGGARGRVQGPSQYKCIAGLGRKDGAIWVRRGGGLRP